MTSVSPYTAVLTCHPETQTYAVKEIEAHVDWTEDNIIAFTYTLKGDLRRLRIPLPQTPRRADRLWQHTCFEAFVALKDKPEYYEFNFAPSGQWAAYSFQRYRDGQSVKDEEPVSSIATRSIADGLTVEALVHLDCLQTIQTKTSLRLGLSAVIEEKNGTVSYWALKHPPGKPDFHHPDAFALELLSREPEAAKGSTMETR